MPKHQDREFTENNTKRVPLWKWVVIILLVIGMPLLFSLYRNAQISQALQNAPAVPAQGSSKLG